MKAFIRIPRSFFNAALLFAVAAVFLLPDGNLGAREDRPYRIGVFASRNIRPYVEAVDGLRDRLGQRMDVRVDVHFLDQYGDKTLESLAEQVSREAPPDLAAAVGPEAAVFVWDALAETRIPKVYSLVLNPETIISLPAPGISPQSLVPEGFLADLPAVAASPPPMAGISLKIPPAEQLRAIHQGLPEARRIGIFFDPAHNQEFYDQASAAVSELRDAEDEDVNISLVPMTVTSRKDIPFYLSECWDAVDCIWLIADRTVISESIAQHIIKEALLKKIPVVGFNRFFYDSGAAMAFVFDYQILGAQAGDLVADVLENGASGSRDPVFSVWLNKTVLRKLGLPVPEGLAPPMEVGP